MEYNDKIVNVLWDLIHDNGVDVIKDSSKVEGLLSDLSPDTKKENYLVILSIKSGLTDVLFFNENEEVETSSVIRDSKEVLSNQFSVKEDAIQWIEELWNQVQSYQSILKMEPEAIKRIVVENTELKKKVTKLEEEIRKSKDLYKKLYQEYYEDEAIKQGKRG